MMLKREMPKEIQATIHFWITRYRRWWKYHYLLGIIALVLSITVASRPQLQFLPGGLFDVLAWLAALTVGFITFLTPSKKARAYVAAARILSDARNRYENDPDYPIERLLDAVKEGEEQISHADPV